MGASKIEIKNVVNFKSERCKKELLMLQEGCWSYKGGVMVEVNKYMGWNKAIHL